MSIELSGKDAVVFSEMVNRIDQDLESRGVTFILNAPLIVVNGEKGLLGQEAVYNGLNDLVIATVGFTLLGYPELLFMCGPAQGEMPVSEADLYMRACYVSDFCRDVMDKIKKHNSNPMDDCEAVGISSRLYTINKPTPSQLLSYVKTNPLSEVYYDYKGIEDVLIMVPVFSDSLSIFKHTLSKVRH